MRRSIFGLGAVVLLGAVGCHRSPTERPGPNVPGAPTTHEAYAAQQLTEQAFEQAERAKVEASKALDTAHRAQQDAADAQHQLALAQANLNAARSDKDRQKAQQQLQQAQQKAQQAQAVAQEKTRAAVDAQTTASVADGRYQALSRAVQVTVVHPRGANTGNGATVLPGTVGPLETAQGKVESVGRNGTVVLQTPQQSLTLQTDGTTQVNLNGQLVQLHQLPPGLEARVAYTPGQPPVARRIDASSVQPPSGPAAQPAQPVNQAPGQGESDVGP